jgi:hypothetical protein
MAHASRSPGGARSVLLSYPVPGAVLRTGSGPERRTGGRSPCSASVHCRPGGRRRGVRSTRSGVSPATLTHRPGHPCRVVVTGRAPRGAPRLVLGRAVVVWCRPPTRSAPLGAGPDPRGMARPGQGNLTSMPDGVPRLQIEVRGGAPSPPSAAGPLPGLRRSGGGPPSPPVGRSRNSRSLPLPAGRARPHVEPRAPPGVAPACRTRPFPYRALCHFGGCDRCCFRSKQRFHRPSNVPRACCLLRRPAVRLRHIGDGLG